jgi:hypothetical protein
MRLLGRNVKLFQPGVLVSVSGIGVQQGRPRAPMGAAEKTTWPIWVAAVSTVALPGLLSRKNSRFESSESNESTDVGFLGSFLFFLWRT